MSNPDAERTATGVLDWVSDGDPVQTTVLAIIAAAAGCETVAPDMTFGAIGGDSLSATQVLARVWRLLDVRLPLSSLAPDTEIGSFVALVKRGRADRDDGGTAIAPDRAGGNAAESLTPGQVAILLSAELSGPQGAAAATLPVVRRIRGALDRAALHDSLDALVRRHQALSLSLGDQGNGLAQRQLPIEPIELPVVDAGRDHLEVARQHLQTPLDPAAPPLLRPLLVQIGPADHLLVITIHHAVCDGWSVGILLRELAALYESSVTAAPPPALGESPGFLDFARWQQQLLAREQDALVSFWRSALEPLPGDRWLPTDFERPHFRSGRGAAEPVGVDSEVFGDLRVSGGEQGATTFMSLLAAFAIVLAELSGKTDLVIGAPMANRSHPLLAGTVGYLSNTVPIRLDLDGDPTVREVIGRVRRASLDAYDHQALPLSSLIAALSPKRDVSVPPVFQVCLVLNDTQTVPMHGVEVEPVLLHKGTSPYDLTLYLEQRPDSLDGYVEYPTDLFRPQTIERLRGRLIEVLRTMAADPDTKALR
ncbi:MAG TPA: condensation domain-containing protein [Solirubrobacterales bacterium]|nr:condensation domain-containing protein [Solirubrobacterales bacterium]